MGKKEAARCTGEAIVWTDEVSRLGAKPEESLAEVQAAVTAWPGHEEDLALLVWENRRAEASADDEPPAQDGRIASAVLYRLRGDDLVAPKVVARLGDDDLVAPALNGDELAFKAWNIWYGGRLPANAQIVDWFSAWVRAAEAGELAIEAYTSADACRVALGGECDRDWVAREATRRAIEADVRMHVWAWLAGALQVGLEGDPTWNEGGKLRGPYFPALDAIGWGYLGDGFSGERS